MSDEKAPAGEPPKKKKPGLFKRMLAAPKSWTVVTRATVLLSCFLITTVVTCWIMYQVGYEHVPWRHYMTWPRLFVVIGLLIAIPIVFHKALKLWLEGEAARFPDLEKAWHAGLTALRKQGITLDSAPLFLVLGANDEQQERSIMNSHPTPLSVVGVPKGPAPLHWYANSGAIYLFCSDTSWLTSLNRLRKSIEDEATVLDMAMAAMPSDDTYEGYSAPPPRPDETVVPTPASARGTIMLDQFVGESSEPNANYGAQGNISGTMTLEAPVARPAVAHASPAPSHVTAKKQPVVVPSSESTTKLQSLQNVCQLVRNARQPYCPLNGVLTLLPFGTIDATGKELQELQRAIRSDLEVIRTETQLRTPVTALVVGLEDELGFRELVRRVGREKSAVQRFGSRFDTRCDATPDHLEKFSTHVCGAFEDWVYTLFREKGALSRPGNPRLYSLLCKVRCILTQRLGRILSKGFAVSERENEGFEPTLFSGCYFAATGRTPDRQAFVQGVLSKLVSEQEQTEWTDRAIALERRYSRLLFTGFAVNAVLLALLVTLIVI
ncbi:MAG: hypothetical protein KDB27_12335 [Planctomycetales bacterium]|nr:hypothetical protein [Planctomycetales bacterium]